MAMNVPCCKAAKKLIPENYVELASQATKRHHKLIQQLLEQRKCPINGWKDTTIEVFLQEISLMDSNNFVDNCGIGEREARIASEIVLQRHFRMCHGIGRSGDITEAQPKAAGSSLLNVLANSVVLDVLKQSGTPSTKACFIVPLATGMSLTLCLLSFRQQRPKARYVVWSRIDQKSVIKSIITAGFQILMADPIITPNGLQTNVQKMKNLIEEFGEESILCVMCTTSCFAPRNPDELVSVAKLCKDFNLPHVVNNAYGIQCRLIMNSIEKASRKGRVDCFVQSTDKNFMVPVGGAIIAGFDHKFITSIGKNYPGRGSSAPSLDVLITLLGLGMKGYFSLIQERTRLFNLLKSELEKIATKNKENLLISSTNTISIGLSLSAQDPHKLTQIGSMLFSKQVSGARVVVPGETKSMGAVTFLGWGSHHPSYPTAYLTAAASIGITEADVTAFITKLKQVLTKFYETKKKSMIPTAELLSPQTPVDKEFPSPQDETIVAAAILEEEDEELALALDSENEEDCSVESLSSTLTNDLVF